LIEIDYGAWTGCSFTCLANLPEWQRFNSFRSSTRPPGGELMLEAQARLVGALEGMAQSHPGRSVAVVTHADLIRAALCHYGCIPLDCCLRFEISPASVTVFQLHDESALVVRVNDTEER
jgi:broad specificity phosphatase PhoE